MTVSFPDLRPRVQWLPDGSRFAFSHPWKFEVDGGQVEVEPGFESDGASVPWFGRWAVPRTGRHLFAAIVHDYFLKEGRSWYYSNRAMLAAMRSASLPRPVNSVRVYLIFSAVSVYGLFRTTFPK